MNEFLRKLKLNAEENPALTIAALAGLLTGVAKIVDSVAHYSGSRAYSKDVKRRVKASQK